MEQTIHQCLACGSPDLKLSLDLGDQPLANDYDSLNPQKYPLQLLYCENCYHAQLSLFLPPEQLYKHYSYLSGTSNTLKRWFADFADRFDEPGSMLDIAANDGSLIEEFWKRGWAVAGIDPAENIDSDVGHIIHAFFGEDTRLGKFDLITAFNVLAHGANPLGILKGIYDNLKHDGEAYVMVSQGNMFANGQFDTIYHEHHSFFSPNSFQELANRAGFTDIQVGLEPIHGGSYLFGLKKGKTATQLPQNRPDFEGFADKANRVKPYKIVGYGAAAKGVVVINKLKQKLEYVVDESPLKIGKKIPGTDIPIVDPLYMAEDDDNLLIIIYAWNFYDEISEKIERLRPNRDDIVVSYWR
jgi:SAM-dependent methyltransferase